MRTRILRRTWLLGALTCTLAAALAFAAVKQTAAAKQARAIREMATAAQNLLIALTPEQSKQARFEFKDAERVNWHFIPRPRKGLSLKDMSPVQQRLAFALLSSGLSQRGYQQATTIMTLEEILKELEKGTTGPVRDPEQYFVSIFGEPGKDSTWGWRVEGHHLALNFTIVGGKAVAGAPNFFGTNPAEVRVGPRKGLRVLDDEEDLARKLVKSLSEDHLKKTLIDVTAPKEILTGNMRKAMLEKPAGLAISELSNEQQELLMSLVECYARRLRPELADGDVETIEQTDKSKILFAWAGGTDPGQAHYYRIHGPAFLIEYDNTQNNANHIHAVWRDLLNDFGDDILEKHYKQASKEHGHDANPKG